MELRALMLCIVAIAMFSSDAWAQPSVQTAGATIVVPAYGEVKQANDQARLVFMLEEQDKERARAESRVSEKMSQGVALLRKNDPGAQLKTRGYYTFPVYAEEGQRPANKLRPVIGWRIGQYLDVSTTNLAALPTTVVSAQSVLSLQNISFELTDSARRKLEERRVSAAWDNLLERIGAIAKAMGRSTGDAVLETIDFEASGNYAAETAMPRSAMKASMQSSAAPEAPSLEPGETTLQTRVVGRFKFR